MAARVPSSLPLSAENVALIRQHVPESVLSQLENWRGRISVVECVMRHTAITQVPDTLVRKLFFMRQFEDARSSQGDPSIVEGVALAFFHKIEIANPFRGREGMGAVQWEIRACAFENSQPKGYYRYQFSEINRESWSLRDFEDAHMLCWNPAISPQRILEQEVPRLLELDARFRPIEFPEPNPAAFAPEVRPWYQRLFDALNGCLSSFLDCLKRCIGFTT